MRRMLNAEPMHGSLSKLRSWHLEAAILHAMLSRQFRAILLSSATVLSVSLFTVVTIVLIVTTVNSSFATTGEGPDQTAEATTSISEGLPVSMEMVWAVEAAQQAGYTLDYQDNAGYVVLPILNE